MQEKVHGYTRTVDAVRGRGREVAFLAFAIVVAATSLTGTLWVFLGDSSEGRRGKGSLEAAIARDFTPPKSYDVASLTRERPLRCGVRDVQCVRRYMASITDEYGPRAAVALVSHWKKDGRISPSLDEHNLAHVIGRKTAQRFGANVEGFNLCPIAFNYGCPHGFFEYVLGRAGTPKEAAGLICEAQNDSSIATAAFSCYHGVGHGVMMAQAYDLDRSLTTCNTLGNTTAHVGCWQGVFMENVNAAVQNQARKGLFTPTHPLAPCDRVAERYQQQCFINHAGWLMKVARNDIGRATRFCLAAPRSQVSTCMQSIGLMVTNPVWQRNLSDDFGRRSFADVA